MESKIVGFAVVRSPRSATAPYHKPNYRLGAKYYHGVDRLAWEDLRQAFYSKTLPENLSGLYSQIKYQENQLNGIQVTRDYGLAEAAAGLNPKNSEIIAIYSAELECELGLINCKLNLKEMGKDCFALGEWSLILRGVFARPNYFESIISKLNNWGLVDHHDDCKQIEERYQNLTRSEIVEPLMREATFSCITVYKIESPEF